MCISLKEFLLFLKSGMRKALCLSFAPLSETGLGEGELCEAMGCLSAVRMDERGTLIHDTQGGVGRGGCMAVWF